MLPLPAGSCYTPCVCTLSMAPAGGGQSGCHAWPAAWTPPVPMLPLPAGSCYTPCVCTLIMASPDHARALSVLLPQQ